MGNISRYCPHCASEKVYTFEIHYESEIEGMEFEAEGGSLYYECGDCHSTWEPHEHVAVHFYGTS